jgi:hypothetical protein
VYVSVRRGRLVGAIAMFVGAIGDAGRCDGVDLSV